MGMRKRKEDKEEGYWKRRRVKKRSRRRKNKEEGCWKGRHGKRKRKN